MKMDVIGATTKLFDPSKADQTIHYNELNLTPRDSQSTFVKGSFNSTQPACSFRQTVKQTI
jgi:hypothetical protein